MNPQWITAVIAGAGLLANGVWCVVNLRIENRILVAIAAVKGELQDWCEERFVRKADAPVHLTRAPHGTR